VSGTGNWRRQGSAGVEDILPEGDGWDAGVARFLGVVAFDDEPSAGGGLSDALPRVMGDT
jgi:hypothetical protein